MAIQLKIKNLVLWVQISILIFLLASLIIVGTYLVYSYKLVETALATSITYNNLVSLWALWMLTNYFLFFLFLCTSSQVQHSWWHSVGRTGQHHTRCPGDGIRCRWQGNGPRSRTRSMMTSPTNNAATSSTREAHTKQSKRTKNVLYLFLNFVLIFHTI